MTETVALAHAEHSNLSVLHLERFIFEFATVDGTAKLLVLVMSDLTHLDVHAFDDSVNLGAHVGASLVVGAVITGAKSKEICNGPWSQVVEEFKVDSLVHSAVVDVDLGVLARLRSVNHLAERVRCESLVHDVHRVVHVGEAVEDVGSELLRISDILAVVEKDEVVTRVLIENALQLVCNLLDVLLPLGLEELEALARHDLGVLLLQVLHCRHALVEGGVRDLAGDCNFDGRCVLCGRCVTHL